MKRLDLKYHTLYPPMNTLKSLREPLSESEILDLQDVFLSNGFHHIRVKNIDCGRSIMQIFLRTLYCYNDIACLTMGSKPLEPKVCDVFSELVQGNYLDQFNLHNWDEFFIEQFYYDFMWIEATHQLVTSPWFAEFEDKIVTFKIDQHIPVVIVS